jgi:cytochrome c553
MHLRVNWKHAAVALAVLPFAAVFVAWIGFFNVGASTGHWKITDWFLHFAMRSAVRTYSLAVEAPAELPGYAIQPAAGHYARGCAICHGAPGEPRSPTVREMLPRPPDLAKTVDQWTDAELFRIVKHGVRFTGMPAWPTQARDDEVWAMVAFLRELPRMDGVTYRGLAFGDNGPSPATGAGTFEQTLAECTRCHGEDGGGRSPAVPVIAGQNEAYLLASLRAYAEGRRASGIMALAASDSEPERWPALARHFAALPRVQTAASAGDDTAAGQGEEIAQHGRPADDIPACLSCHGEAERNPHYAIIAGQPAEYIAQQLKLFKHNRRAGTPYGRIMTNVAKSLKDADIQALATYFAELPPSDSRP